SETVLPNLHITSGWKRLVAYGSFSTIIILDPDNARNFGSNRRSCDHFLQGFQVKWAPENFYHDHKNPYGLRLASADASGMIIIWDVVTASVVSEICEPGHNVLDFQWIEDQNVSRDLLFAIHSKGICILWNTQTQTPLWKTSVNEHFLTVSMDPHNMKNIMQESPSLGSSKCATDASTNGATLERPTPKRDSSDLGSISPPDCLQVCYHGYRKDCVLFVFRRKITITSLLTSQALGTISLDRTIPSFCRVYSCIQRDVLICLHENGGLSVYAHSGLICPVKGTHSSSRPASATTSRSKQARYAIESYTYDLIASVEGSRRFRQTFRPVFTVDQAREVSIAVSGTEGRVQFWHLRPLPLQMLSSEQPQSLEPFWCLSDIVPHQPGLGRSRKLCLQMSSIYTSNKSNPTVCRVCPPHLSSSFAAVTGYKSLVAVGNTRGSVLIWDMDSGCLWREYQVLSVPVLGVEWVSLASGGLCSQADVEPLTPDVDGASASDGLNLGVFVQGWQPRERLTSAAADSSVDESQQEGRNFTVLLNLITGFITPIRSTSMDTTASGTPVRRGTNSASTPSYESPIECAHVSHYGQYLAILLRNQHLELWSLHNLKLIQRLSFGDWGAGVALDWYQSVAKPTESSSPPSFMFALERDENSKVSDHHRSPTQRNLTMRRESLIMCSTTGNLRLVVVDGSEVDSTVISQSILQGLPASSLERLSAVAWFADLIALGTSDGFVVVRDLHNKKTMVRVTSGNGWFSTTESPPVEASITDPKSSVAAISLTSRHTTGVRRLKFLYGSPTYSRLLVLLHDSVYIWQPREMTLLCMARFGGRDQRCVVSADWACPVFGPTNPAICLLVGADGALRLVQAGPTAVEMTPAETANSSSFNPELPSTRFFGSSAIPDLPDANDTSLVPAMRPSAIALTIRHLLQNQPWLTKSSEQRSPTADELLEGITEADIPSGDDRSEFKESTLQLVCPPLARGFHKVRESVDAFLHSLAQRTELRKAFLRPSATIIERCLWTAQLFGDTYEIRFWRMVASRMLPGIGDERTHYALDLSWDLLADHSLYKSSAISRLNLLESSRSTVAHRNECIHYLLLLGQHERAVSLLLETPPNSPNYSANMHRACLLAANLSGKFLSPQNPSANQVAEDTYLSTVKLVATNLLSNGQLDTGIELLCLIGLYSDACRYLESFDRWEQSIWLAKCTLPDVEINRVLRRYAAYLSSPQVNRKDFAVLIYVLLDEHNMALKLLFSLNQFQLAARYLEACLQMGKLSWSTENVTQFSIFIRLLSFLADHLYSAIFMEFCKILIKLGHRGSASYYSALAGKLKDTLKNEIDFMLS
ncbi:WD domain, G-beta repeat protein, partial [Opisthorchis viverrini]